MINGQFEEGMSHKLARHVRFRNNGKDVWLRIFVKAQSVLKIPPNLQWVNERETVHSQDNGLHRNSKNLDPETTPVTIPFLFSKLGQKLAPAKCPEDNHAFVLVPLGMNSNHLQLVNLDASYYTQCSRQGWATCSTVETNVEKPAVDQYILTVQS